MGRCGYLYKKNFFSHNKLFYVFKPVLCNMQQIKPLEEASELFVSKTEKNGQQNMPGCNLKAKAYLTISNPR